MSQKSMDTMKIENILTSVYGKEAWGADLGYGSFLTVEFGQPVKTDPKSSRKYGEWNLWLYGCAWRIEQTGSVLAGCEDEREDIKAVVGILNGKKLVKIEFGPVAFDTVFRFEDNLDIRTFQIYRGDMENWFFYFPEHKVLSIGPGINWSFNRSDQA